MRIVRTLAASTLTAALAISGATVAADAAPKAKQAQVKPTKSAKAEKTTSAVTKVVLTARTLDRQLAALATSQRVARLNDLNTEVVTTNIADDRAEIAALVETTKADPTYAPAAYSSLRAYKVVNYTHAVGYLATAERLAVAAEALAPQVAAEAPDQQDNLDQSVALITEATDAALALTGTSATDEVRSVKAPLVAATTLLSQVRDALAAV